MQGFLWPEQECPAGLHPGQAVHAFELPGLRTRQPRLKRAAEIADVYCRELSALYPAGPIHLLGFCIGSLLAIEMAQQLAASGRPVDRLVLIDPTISWPLPKLHAAGQWDDEGACLRFQSEERRATLEARVRKCFLHLKNSGRDPLPKRYPGHDFSVDARAKLSAALLSCKPAPLPLLAHAIMSRERVAASGIDAPHGTAWDKLLPRRKVHIVAETHVGVLTTPNGATADLIQDIFDGHSRAEKGYASSQEMD